MSLITTIVGWVFGIIFSAIFFWLMWNFLIKDIVKTIKEAKKNNQTPKVERPLTNGLGDASSLPAGKIDPLKELVGKKIFCSNCGNEVGDQDNFCNTCGRKLK